MVLSDGMGHGVKANILSTLTASIFIGMACSGEAVESVARQVMRTLPVCSRRGISYSTFTLVDIDHRSSMVEIVEFDNPPSMIFRGSTPLECQWECITYQDPNLEQMRTLLKTRFCARRGDRIVVVSDGVTQSGLGTDTYPFGWGAERLHKFLRAGIAGIDGIDASEMAWRITNQAIENDNSRPKDDITTAVVYFREPRRLILASCLPSLREQEAVVADMLAGFEGSRLVCDYPLAEAMAANWGQDVVRNPTSTDPDVAPEWRIKGLTRVTEGLVTLSKALYILKVLARPDDSSTAPRGRGAAYHICEELLRADRIEIVIGLRNADPDPAHSGYDAAECDRLLELQRRTIASIAELLERKFSKLVRIKYM